MTKPYIPLGTHTFSERKKRNICIFMCVSVYCVHVCGYITSSLRKKGEELEEQTEMGSVP
jgi:hypothetical protein